MRSFSRVPARAVVAAFLHHSGFSNFNKREFCGHFREFPPAQWWSFFLTIPGSFPKKALGCLPPIGKDAAASSHSQNRRALSLQASMAKRLADLATEDLHALLHLSRKRVRQLETLIAKRQEDVVSETEARPTHPCMTCCDHVWRSHCTGPRDNGEFSRICEKCGLCD